MTRTVGLALLSAVAFSCATGQHYVRRPEAERSAHVFTSAVRVGMTLLEVVRTMVESRLPGQYASLSSAAPNGDTVKIMLHAGEPLATVGRTQVRTAGYASLEVYRRAEMHLQSHGFERQGPFLAAIEARQQELLAYPRFVLAFDASMEGGCGDSTISLAFAVGQVSEVGQVEESLCGR